MSRKTAVLFCPGRGSYGREELGFLATHRQPGAVEDALVLADARREADDVETITAIDAAPRFRPGLHVQGINAAELIYFGTLFHVEHLREKYDIVAVAGNSLGWYTALVAGGALDPAEGWKLVRTMAGLQDTVAGGQVLTTIIDEEWRPDAAATHELEHALHDINARGADHFVTTSIRLGGHEVLGGTERGIAALLKALPKRKVGEREFPFQLAGTGPFHTSLCQATAKIAKDRLAELPIGMPRIHTIDGRGNVHTPWSASPRAMLEYTVSTQVLETFDFSAATRTAIREFNPDVLLCAGPGASLRAPVGHVVLREGYRGIRSRRALFDSGLVEVG